MTFSYWVECLIANPSLVLSRVMIISMVSLQIIPEFPSKMVIGFLLQRNWKKVSTTFMAWYLLNKGSLRNLICSPFNLSALTWSNESTCLFQITEKVDDGMRLAGSTNFMVRFYSSTLYQFPTKLDFILFVKAVL